ncbi:MAG: serine hydrolase domain-containing protein, partial [Pseudomonadota bacterium]
MPTSIVSLPLLRIVPSLWRGLLLVTAMALSSVQAVSSESIDTQKLYAKLDSQFSETRLDMRAPGLVYGVVVDGELMHLGAFGVRRLESAEAVTDKTAFRIASMTKMMTALLIGDLHDQGKLSLDAPAETYLPALKSWRYPTTDSRKVTVRDFLNHTAGFVWDDPWADRQMARSQKELDSFLARAQPFTDAPGAQWEYSNLGYVLLGRIIENLSGQTFAERLQQRILDPLEMSDSGLEVNDISAETRAYGYQWIDGEFVPEPVLGSGAFDPLGGVWTTGEDYAKFIGWFLSAWPARDDPDPGLIPRRVVRAVTDGAYVLGPSRPPGLNGENDCTVSTGYGRGLSIVRHCDAGLMLRHSGGFPGFGTHVIMMPELGIGVFGFANRTYTRMSGPVFDAAVTLVRSGIGKRPDAPAPDSRLLAAYQGLGEAYAAGAMDDTDLEFEDNFFQDRSADRWNKQLAAMKREAGACDASAPMQNDGRLSAAFDWNCETARITGYFTLSPLDPEELQMLHMRAVRRDGNGRDLKIDFDW